MRASDKNLTVLSEAERIALYGVPDFDDFQRAEYFALTEAERALAQRRRGVDEQLLCLLQIGYFKAKQAFFKISLADVPREDIDFLRRSYFPDEPFSPRPVRQAEYYAQRGEIARFYGYRLWSEAFAPQLAERAADLALRDVTPAFLLTELLAFLSRQKIVRPGYTTLQAFIAEALAAERRRLGGLVDTFLKEADRNALQQLLVREETLSGLAALKQDAKHFGYRMMVAERLKRATLEPAYRLAKQWLPHLGISQRNVGYYASLVQYYTIYDLRRLKSGQASLYLLCYAFQRYRQLTDNLVEALGYHMKRLEERTKASAASLFSESQSRPPPAEVQVGRLLLLYVDDAFQDATPFGTVRQHAFGIMPQDSVRAAGQRLCETPTRPMELRWQAAERWAWHCKKHLRPLATALAFSSTTENSPWLAALAWMKQVFARQQTLASRPWRECPEGTVPKRLQPYLVVFDDQGKATGVRGDRYEFWVYRQVRKRLLAGELYLDDSLHHRRFSDELITPERTPEVLGRLDIPWTRQPLDTQLEALFAELERRWRTFDRELSQGKLKHLDFDPVRKTLTWRKPKADPDAARHAGFYGKLPARALADIFRFVNGRCQFLQALTPLQPRYAKKVADDNSLMAVIFAQAMNHGHATLAETSDIPYHILEATHQQHLRLATLRAANDRISNFIAGLSIFPHYSFDLEVLYGGVDGQKFEVARPTVKARHSRKYFGRGKGVVAYTLLANHVPLQTELIGAHQHESHFVFDLCYSNTSDIVPTVITGDMHSVNKANFALLHWFGLQLAPRFTNLQAQLKQLYAGGDPADYAHFLIAPAGQIDRSLILAEQARLDQIVATLALKDITQSTLVRKLCTYTAPNPTRRALFEFDKLIRSLYTLNYLRDPQLQRDVHRSQNRIEAYHQLRSAIAQVGGRKQLLGQTDLDVAISNQCGRLLANVVIAYNSILLSALLDRHQAAGNLKALGLLKTISPVAWQHIHFLGHYAFQDDSSPIDVEALLANIVLA